MNIKSIFRIYFIVTSLLLMGCKNNQPIYDFGNMAGIKFGCYHGTQAIDGDCPIAPVKVETPIEEVMGNVRTLIKSKRLAQAETYLKQSLMYLTEQDVIRHALVDVYIRQQKWNMALALINQMGIEVNDPLRLTIEARVGMFSIGTDIDLLPQIYRNKLNNSEPQRANIETDHLTYFELTRVDEAPTGSPSMEPSIKVSNDGQHVLVAWMDHVNFPVHVPWHMKGQSAYSSNGGATWQMLPASSDFDVIELFDLDLITAYDPNQNYMYTSGITWGVDDLEDFMYFYRLNLSTGIQDGPFVVQGDDGGSFPTDYDKALMAVDDGGGLLLTTYVPGTVKYSADFAENFVDLMDVPEGMAQPRFYNGCLYLVSQVSPRFWRCDMPTDSTVITPASDNWWGYEQKVSGTFQVHNLTYMAIHPDGDIYILFSELEEVGSNELVIWMSKSTDNGASWHDAWIVTPDYPGDQFLPWIEIDQSGVIHISYVDTRNNPQNDDASVTYLDTYYSRSEDGGQSWYESRVTPVSFELVDGISYSYTYSDYNEMAVSNSGTVFLSFPWSPSGNDMDMYVAKKIILSDLIFRDGYEL